MPPARRYNIPPSIIVKKNLAPRDCVDKVLMRLRDDEVLTERLLHGVRAMKESVTYQAVVEEGRQEEARRILLRLGADRFGDPPTADQLGTLDAITDADRLGDLAVRALRVGNWAELLAPH
jgi:hypothetical protein